MQAAKFKVGSYSYAVQYERFRRNTVRQLASLIKILSPKYISFKFSKLIERMDTRMEEQTDRSISAFKPTDL